MVNKIARFHHFERLVVIWYMLVMIVSPDISPAPGVAPLKVDPVKSFSYIPYNLQKEFIRLEHFP